MTTPSAAGRAAPVLGVNYHPTRAGCRLWRDWDLDAIDEDFAAIAACGLGAVRVFLFWRDFQPGPDEIDPKMLARLRALLACAGEHGLGCVLSLLTIWMNGQRLDLGWRRRRSLWRDPEMVAAAERYARAVARVGRDAGAVLAIDLGDEIANVELPEALALEPRELACWYGRLRSAIQAEAPGTPVMQANDVSGVLGASPFGPDAQGGLDVVGVHGWPLWSPGSIESTASAKASLLAGFLAAAARPFGPPLIDELGSYGVDDGIAAGHLRAASVSALANGATGVLAWCWRDIVSGAEPYDDRPAERSAGLCRADGTPKPALAAFREVVDAARVVGDFVADPARVAVYLPERARQAGTSYLDPGCGTVACFVAWLLAKRAHLALDVVAGDIDAGYDLVVCPSARHLTATDLARLHDHAERGGTAYVSVADHVGGLPDEALGGVRAVDFTHGLEGRGSFAWAGRSWPLPRRGDERGFTVAATAATVEARYEDGAPAVTVNRVGAGLCVLCTAPIEDRLDAPGRLDGAGWEGLYRELARRAGVVPALACDQPEVELVVGRRAGARVALLVNHAARALEVTFRAGDGAPAPAPRVVPAKGWGLVELGGRPQ